MQLESSQFPEATLDHNTRIDAATVGAAHNNLAQPLGATAIDLTATHYIDHITDYHTQKFFRLFILRLQ